MEKLQFIVVSHPSGTTSSKSKKVARSHSAREVHARNRRLRTVEHQIQSTPSAIAGAGTAVSETRKPRDGSNAAPKDTIPVAIPRNRVLSPASLLSADRRDPFNSFASPLDPTEQYLFDYYVTVVIPYLSLHCTAFPNPSVYMEAKPNDWVRLAITDVGLMQGILLAACRHLCEHLRPCLEDPGEKREYYLQLATSYKVACVQALISALPAVASSLHVSDATLAKVMVLALDEIWLGDYEMSRRHILGAVKLVELNGGPETFGLNGILSRMFLKFVKDAGMLDLLDEMMDPCERVAVQMCTFEPELSAGI